MSSTIEFEDNPPRPAGGSGDVVVKVGSADVTLTWSENRITNVAAADEGGGKGADFSDLRMEEQKLGIVSCYRCARDTDTGRVVCWDVACT